MIFLLHNFKHTQAWAQRPVRQTSTYRIAFHSKFKYLVIIGYMLNNATDQHK